MASMKWPHRYPARGDIMGALLVAALPSIAVAVAAALGPQQRSTAGFGPDWDCKVIPRASRFASRSPAHPG
jgi:hypothetical protein